MSDKYTLTKEGKADVNTSSESVKYRHLADGYELHENKQAGTDEPSAAPEVTIAVNSPLSTEQVAAAVAAKPSNKPNTNR